MPESALAIPALTPQASTEVVTVTLVGGATFAFVAPTVYQTLSPPLPPFLRVGTQIAYTDFPLSSVAYVQVQAAAVKSQTSNSTQASQAKEI